MKRLISTYRFLNVISVDISLGAVICSLFFTKVMGADVRPIAYLALGLTVWIVYTIDHLLDAKRLTTTASTQRHKFHQQHFKTLSVIVVVAIVVNGCAVLSVRRSLFVAGFLLSLIVIFYLLLQRYFSPFKEFFSGILYTAGVTLPAVMFGFEVNTLPHLLVIANFIFIVWMNLLLFSMFDKDHDKWHGYISFTTKMGEASTRIVILVLFLLSILFGTYQIVYYDWYAAVILLLMSIILFIIFLNEEKFVDKELFRLVGDVVFLLPVFYVIGK